MLACRKSLAGLRFDLDGQDLTGADARLTQALIERELSVGLLSRAAFHGQADITSLLEARVMSCICCHMPSYAWPGGHHQPACSETPALISCSCTLVLHGEPGLLFTMSRLT